MNRVYIGVIAGLLTLCGYLYWQNQSIAHLEAANAALVQALDRAQEREKRDRKVMVARQAEIASQARKLAQAKQTLSEALQQNKPWSDTDVPPDVQKALGGASGPVPDGL